MSRISLPFQVIENVNVRRTTRKPKKGGVQGMFFFGYKGKGGDTFEVRARRNKLIWGDNLVTLCNVHHDDIYRH